MLFGPQAVFDFASTEASVDSGASENYTHITAVYGGSATQFAYLRAYFDENNRSFYHKLSPNLMQLPRLLSLDESETIEDPQIELGLKLKTDRFGKRA